MNMNDITDLFGVIIEENDVVFKSKYANTLWFLVEKDTDLPPKAILYIRQDLKSPLEAEGWVNDDEIDEEKTILEWKKWLKNRRNRRDGKYAMVMIWSRLNHLFVSIDDAPDNFRSGVKFEMLTYQDQKVKKYNKELQKTEE